MATLVDLDYNMLEIPRYLLPSTVAPGSIVRISMTHDITEEERRSAALAKMERDIKARQLGKGTKILEE
jgi:hypothetical protein